jgi:hypothetical protein
VASSAIGIISTFLFIFIWLAALFNAAGKSLIYVSAIFYSLVIFLAGLLFLGFGFITGLSGHTPDSAAIMALITFFLGSASPLASLFILKKILHISMVVEFDDQRLTQ